MRYLLFLFFLPLLAQTPDYGRTAQEGALYDLTAASRTMPIKAGPASATPSTCTASKELYIKTDAAAGQQLFICNASGSGFVLVGDGTGAEAYTLPPASASTLGGIRVGSGLIIDGLGVVTAPSGAFQTSVLGMAGLQAVQTLTGTDMDLTATATTISSGLLGPSGCVRATLGVIGTGASTKSVRIQFGATQIAMVTGVSLGANGQYVATVCNSSSNTQFYWAAGQSGTTLYTPTHGTLAIDTSSAVVIKGVVNSASTTDTVQVKFWLVERL